MKKNKAKIIARCTIVIMFFCGGIFSSTIDDVIANANKCFASGNLQGLYPYLSNNTEVIVLEKSAAYCTKSQVITILTVFFQENPVQNYSVKQGGSVSENTKFSIGNFNSTKGDFKIYFVVKKNGSEEQITKISIEKR